MKNKKFDIQKVDVLGIIAYIIIVISCFLPFLEYTTVMGSSELIYFQGNGKILLVVSILATVLIFFKKFKFIVICLGLSIGIFAYDIVFGLLKVAREITNDQTLKIGFFLIVLGLVINLVYVIIKIKKGYQDTSIEIDRDDEDLMEEEVPVINDYEDNFENISKMEISMGSVDEIEENINNDIEVLEVEIDRNNTEQSDISIFSATPDLDFNSDYSSGYEEIKIENKNSSFKYKICPRCGMQMDYDNNKCNVCGNEF